MSDPSLDGTLALYPLPGSDWQRRPYFTSGDRSSPRAVVFIGGLYAGLMDTPFLPALSAALEKAGWRLVQIYWSGCYDGYGTGSLDRDCDELEALSKHLRTQGVETIVLMGHSTGSQDVIHYLTSQRSAVQGGIMVSPASDREFHEANPDPEWTTALKRAKELIAAGKPNECLDLGGTRMTAYRVHSLVGVGGDDDYFSSDLPLDANGVHAHPLSESFGRLNAPALALWAEKDHCGGVLADQRELLRRWEAASNGKLQWDFLEGATHCIEERPAQEQLCARAVRFLGAI